MSLEKRTGSKDLKISSTRAEKRPRRLKSNHDSRYRRLIAFTEPRSRAAEAYRSLCTHVLYAAMDIMPKVILVTSHGPREGKSTTCANLGVALAGAGKRTLVVDCDLRGPSQHTIFGLHDTPGLVNVLAGESELREVVHETPVRHLSVLTSGVLLPNAAELLSSQLFEQFLLRARQEFEYVLMDSPATQLVSDPTVLACLSDGVLLVFDSRNTRKEALRRSVQDLQAIGANVLGTVMNNVEADDIPYHDSHAFHDG